MGDNAPWIVRSGLQSYEWEPIATLGDAFKDLKPNSAAQKRILADAELMAASPALYEALDGLKDILDRAESNASGNMEWEYVSRRINAARAALALARGGEA
jgi:hypothetical protein